MNARRFLRPLVAGLLLTLAAAHVATAQTGGARENLSSFPDAQVVMFLNSQRLLTEALPRVVPQAELDKMFADVQKETNFDPRSIHFVAVGARFREPFSSQTPPDFIVMVKGDFNADALLSIARMAAGAQHTQETYKGRKLDVFDMTKPKKQDASSAGGSGQQPHTQQQPQFQAVPPPSPFPQLAAATMDSSTIIFGVPAFVRAAVDAADASEGRIRPDLLELVTRNPDNLLSLAGDIPASFADMLKSTGMPQNAEIERIVRSLRQVQLSVQMTAADFGLQSIVKTDTAENANSINGLIELGLGFARMGIEEELNKVPANKPDERERMQAALALVNSIRNTASDNEVQLTLSVPQATVATFVQKEMAAQKQRAAQAQTSKPRPKTRRGRRTRRRS